MELHSLMVFFQSKNVDGMDPVLLGFFLDCFDSPQDL